MLQYETSPIFREFADAACRAEKLTHFPARIMLAVWANESAWGQNITGNFNFFGIIRPPENGPAKFCWTHEEVTPAQLGDFRLDEVQTASLVSALPNGKNRYSMQRWFASYGSLDEAILAYTKIFTESPHRYQAAWQRFMLDSDEDGLLKRICEAGYATGNTEDVELAIAQQSNVKHAIDMAERMLGSNVT